MVFVGQNKMECDLGVGKPTLILSDRQSASILDGLLKRATFSTQRIVNFGIGTIDGKVDFVPADVEQGVGQSTVQQCTVCGQDPFHLMLFGADHDCGGCSLSAEWFSTAQKKHGRRAGRPYVGPKPAGVR